MLFPNKPETEQGFPGPTREALLCLWLILRILYRNPSAKAPVIDPGDEAPLLV